MKPLILSFLCHFLFARFLVFTFTPHPVAHKPLFVFLGSILESHDFTLPRLPAVSPPRTGHRRDWSGVGGAGMPFHLGSRTRGMRSDSSGQSHFDFIKEAPVMKPAFLQNVRKGSKKFLKSTFKETAEEKATGGNWAEELGIELGVPRRRPLRLYRR